MTLSNQLRLKFSNTRSTFLLTTVLCILLAGCGGKKTVDYGVKASPRVVAEGQPIPKGGGAYRVGKEYKVGGRWYKPKEDTGYDKTGIASWYGRQFHGRLTANGEVFDMNALTVAHKTLPMPTYVRVTNLANGRSIMARVNDRGPYHDDREVDLSYKVAQILGVTRTGTGLVRVQYAGRARLDGRDEHLFQTAQVHGKPVSVASLIDNAPSQNSVQYASLKNVQPPTVQVTSLTPVTSDAWRQYNATKFDKQISSDSTAQLSHSTQQTNLTAVHTVQNNIDMAYVDAILPKTNNSPQVVTGVKESIVLNNNEIQNTNAIASLPVQLDLPRPRPQI